MFLHGAKIAVMCIFWTAAVGLMVAHTFLPDEPGEACADWAIFLAIIGATVSVEWMIQRERMRVDEIQDLLRVQMDGHRPAASVSRLKGS